jgi:hypothetical protein
MRDDERNQYGFANSPAGEWLRRIMQTMQAGGDSAAYAGMPMPQTPAVTTGAAMPKTPYAPYEANYPAPVPPQMLALRQKMAQDELLRAAPQAAPQAFEANYPPQAINPGRDMAPTSVRPPMMQAPAPMAGARSQEIQYANSPEAAAVKTGDKGMHYWLDKGDGSALMPYYSKTGEQPNLPGMSSFADPNFKPFFGLFGG